MKILAIETCFGGCSVTLLNNQEIIAHISEVVPNKQSEKLILMVEQVLGKANVSYEQVDYIAVAAGPGSFTGIRIGVSAANAIAFASGKKIISINCLEAIAYGKNGKISAILDAGKNQVYAQKFIDQIPYSPITLVDYQAINNFAQEFKKIGNKLSDEPTLPSSNNIALAAYNYLQNDRAELLDTVKPIYIRAPDAKVNITK